MVALQSFFVVVFASTFRLGWTDIEGSRALFRDNDNVHVIGSEPNSLGSTTNFMNDMILDCPHDGKPCLSICCRVGETRNRGVCVPDDTTADMLPLFESEICDSPDERRVSWQNFHLQTDDPCAFDWMVPFVADKFCVLGNGSISVCSDSDECSLYDIGSYCLFRSPESVRYSARICYPLLKKSKWIFFFSICMILISAAIFVVYTVIPEQRNLHGLIFRSYMATYCIIGVGVLAADLTTESRTNAYLFTLSEIIICYCGASIVSWLNVMSFNIWRSFRDLRSIDVNNRERQKEKFIKYAAYAWISPAVIIAAVSSAIRCVPHLHHERLGHIVKIWSRVGVVGVAYTCNAFLFTLTTFAIRRHRRDVANLVNSVNRHHDIAEQWFNLHLKLFVLMGGHIVSWVIWFIWPTETMAHILGTSEVVQVILMFTIFVWKDNVKRSFRNEVSSWRRSNVVATYSRNVKS